VFDIHWARSHTGIFEFFIYPLAQSLTQYVMAECDALSRYGPSQETRNSDTAAPISRRSGTLMLAATPRDHLDEEGCTSSYGRDHYHEPEPPADQASQGPE
jgi:hypothetical protein